MPDKPRSISPPVGAGCTRPPIRRTGGAVPVTTAPGARREPYPSICRRIDVLDSLGRAGDAQNARWDCFQRSLSAPRSRAHLKRLPDFDDVEAEEQALDFAQEARDLLQALAFLISWPALDRAADLVIRRAKELDGDHYEILPPSADALADKHPLAATLLLRAMIDFALTQGRANRYKRAAGHLLECSSLSSAIKDFGGFEAHVAYEARLRREHGKKSSFWSLIA